MRDIIALLRTLVLPAGATSGRRIVLDGDTGVITIFDENNAVRIRIGAPSPSPAGEIEFSTGSVNEALPGAIVASGQGTPGTTEQFLLSMSTPFAAGRENAILDLISQSVNGVLQTQAKFFADVVNVNDGGGGVTADLQVNNISVPRGVLAKAASTVNIGPTSGTTELTLLSTVATIPANRRIRLHAHVRSFAFTIDTDGFALRFKESTTTLNEFALAPQGQTGGATAAADKRGDEFIHYIDAPSAATHTYDLVLVRLTGSGTSTAEAATTFPMQMIMEDVGAA